MTPDDFLEALHQGLHLQGAAQTYRFQQVVGMATEPQLLKEPQSLLGIGQWEGAIPWHRAAEAAPADRGMAWLDSRNVPGHLRYRRCLKEAAEGDLDVRHFAYAGQELCGQEGVSAQLEEVVVDAYTLEIEHLGPEPCQHALRAACEGQCSLCGAGRLCPIGRCQAELLSQTTALQFAGRAYWVWPQQ